MNLSSTHAPLIVGDVEDPHVGAVCSALAARGIQPLVLDLEAVMGAGFAASETRTVLRVGREWIDVSIPRAGWLRRLHRAPWGVGIETGSVQALELGAWHSAFSWILDAAEVHWITSPQHLRAAEGKLHQWQLVRRLGVDYPQTMVTTSADEVTAEFQSDVIVKPLGSGQFIQEGAVRTVFAEAMTATDPRLRSLSAAPFIVQEHIRAERHLRIVTVGERVWVTSLKTSDKDPADWRRTPSNHTAFIDNSNSEPEVAASALAVAKAFHLGYSSQDWVETREGRVVLLDINPSGQWLFLPERIGTEVAAALADQIAGAT